MASGWPSDAQLVSRAKTGRLDAFEELVRRHRTGVYRVALRMLGSPDDAEDVAQDAFVRAWQALPRFRADSSFSTWLHRIVVNRCLNIRRDSRQTEPLPQSKEDPSYQPERVVEARNQLAAAARAIASLDPAHRAAFVLREFEGFSYGEIAAILHVTVPAVKGRIHRTRLELVELMREWS